VIADQMLPGMVGTDFLQKAARLQPRAERILVTASGRVADAQDAVNLAKVRRFLGKPFHPDELRRVVGEAVHEGALVAIREQLVQELEARNGVLSEAVAMLEARDRALERDLAQRTSAFEDLAQKLEMLSVRDGLTGVFNHRYFQEALAAELERARARRRPVALVMFDIDRFHEFNRMHGYAEGDALLRRVVTALALPLGGSEPEIAARYAADTFAVILRGADLARAQKYAERVVLGVAHPPGSGAAKFSSATIRAGIAIHPAHGDGSEALIASARRALEEAKRHFGGNRAVVTAADTPSAVTSPLLPSAAR